ncbi:MAG: hypothetical protein GC151_10415 [Betaproteobacteria bacterium]|nr:hypothetical protein [Betaproteobacteria bacterium]
MAVPIPYVHIGVGALTMLLCVPLIARKVPMNRFYGIRTRRSFASRRNWYEINAFGGKVLFAFGLFLALFGWYAQDAAPPPTSAWAPLFMVVPFLALLPAVLAIHLASRRLDDR